MKLVFVPLKDVFKDAKESANLVSKKMLIGAFHRYQMKCKSISKKSPRYTNLFGLVTGMAEDLQSLVGATVVRRRVYARFLDAVNFVAGNPEADRSRS